MLKRKKNSNWCFGVEKAGDSCNINMVAYGAS
jgi:hypothetical protein